MITEDELADMIAALESQPHLSLKEEKYLAVCWELVRQISAISAIKSLPDATDKDCPYFAKDKNYAVHFADGYNEALGNVRDLL